MSSAKRAGFGRLRSESDDRNDERIDLESVNANTSPVHDEDSLDDVGLHPNSTPSGTLLPCSRASVMIGTLFVATVLVPVTVILSSSPSTSPSSIINPAPLKISYGSCTSYSMEPLPLFSTITSLSPDFFLWLGDVLYLDDPITDCSSPTWVEDCGCSNDDFMRIPPHSCYSGDDEHARTMYEYFQDTEWTRDFREYFRGMGSQRMLGTYDDHDSGWNNGNRRNPAKQQYKELILDFLDVPMDSDRRRSSNGLEYVHRISNDVHVWFLDERWYRDPLPCEIRRSWCTDTVLPDPSHNKHGWCTDYLLEGGCCKATEEVYLGVCAGASQDEELYPYACDHTSPLFGTRNVRASGDAKLEEGEAEDLPFCSMLGMGQRMWLKETLEESDAKVKIVVSGSVLLSNPTWAGSEGKCSGDDWDCYNVEQKWLMNLLTSPAAAGRSGCQPIVLTGDYHFGDIKMACSGPTTAYGSDLGIDHTSERRCVLQHMASGMSHTTAVPHSTCEHPEYLKDHSGMREEAGQDECSLVAGPNFGEMEYAADGRTLSLRSRGEEGGILSEIVLDVEDKCKIIGGKTFHLG